MERTEKNQRARLGGEQMKKLVAELMNHGFSEHQAQEFLQRCYGIFENILAKRVITELNNGLVNGTEEPKE